MKYLVVLFLLGPQAAMLARANPPESQPIECSDVMDQIRAAKAFVGPTNYAFQLSRDKEARAILFTQRPTNGVGLRWRLIERQGQSLNYCSIAEGEKHELLMDVHLWHAKGRYGMPGSGLPRCAAKHDSGLIPSFDIRIWANKELGDSLVFALTNEKGNRDYYALISKDSEGAWILLDAAQGTMDDACYHSRGDSSTISRDVR